MVKLPLRFLKATHVKVKTTGLTRFRTGFGLHCRNENPNNRKIWAGEIATVTTRLVEGLDWSQLVLVATFPHNRFAVLGELENSDGDRTVDAETGTWVTAYDYIEYIIPVKVK